jgi:hypothetical protein
MAFCLPSVKTAGLFSIRTAIIVRWLSFVEKLADRVDATPSSRSCWKKKGAGRRFYLIVPDFSTKLDGF